MLHFSRVCAVAVFLVAPLALASLGPTSPPAGVEKELWARMWQRTAHASRVATEGRSSKDQECGQSKLLVTLYHVVAVVERGLSQATPGRVARVDGTRAAAAKTELHQHRDDTCGPRQGPGSGVSEALQAFVTTHPDWDMEPGYGPALYPDVEPLQRTTVLQQARQDVRKAVEAIQSIPSSVRSGGFVLFDYDALGIYNPVRSRTQQDGL